MDKKSRYEHMLSMQHHVSRKRKPMPIADRAAQFGAFRALTGYEDAIAETERLTDEKIELDEYAKAEINMRLIQLGNDMDSGHILTVTYFIPDEKKQGGEYHTKTGVLKRLMEYERCIVFEDGTVVDIENIASVTIE